VPGLVDGHCHLYGLGKALEEISLRGVGSVEAAATQVAEAARGRAPGEWIEGRGWDQNLWTPKEFPGHAALDAAAPQNPVALRRIDGHALWVNAAALKAAGITRQTAAPAGGTIVKDRKGEPTGVLIDAAMALVGGKIPEPTPEVIRRRILLAAKAATAAGIAGVHEMGIPDEVVTEYRALAAAGELPLRVWALLQGSPAMVESLASRTADRDPGGESRFVLGGVKLYADGALGSRGAALLEPYDDDPGNRGLVVTPREVLARAAEQAARGGWQLAVHAIGDRGNRDVLDAFAAAGVTADRRFRIEHAQVVAPEDFRRFAQLGVIASMQPTHATSDMPWAEARVGKRRIAGAYAWRTMLEAGAHVLGGSDFPVEEVPIVLSLYAATTRMDREGQPPGGWLPEQKLSLDEALRMFTVEPAYASFRERSHGRIAPGHVADVTVFDRELRVESLLDTQVDMTIVGGAVVFERAR
jgi:predicted amidohydrolase YtcJ